MTIIEELAAWAPGENSFTALAEVANLRLKPSRFAGVNTARMRTWVLKGRSDIDVTMRCVALSRDGAFLTKMAKDRRVNVRLAVLDNPAAPIEVLEDASTQQKNWDIRHKAETQITARVRNMRPDDAFALIDGARSSTTLESVLQYVKLTDDQIRSVIGREIAVPGRYGSQSVIQLGRLVAGRSDLKRFSIETLWALCDDGHWVEVAKTLVARNVESELEEFFERLSADSQVRKTYAAQQAIGIIARKSGLSENLANKLFEMAGDTDETSMLTASARRNLLEALSANQSVAWELFLDEPVREFSAQALARAMADTFNDEPAVWLLALELAESQITVGETLKVLSSTFPNAARTVG